MRYDFLQLDYSHVQPQELLAALMKRDFPRARGLLDAQREALAPLSAAWLLYFALDGPLELFDTDL